MMNLFDQFASPETLGISLITIAMLTPICFTYNETRFIPNRVVTIKTWFKLLFTKQLMTPLNNHAHPWTITLLMIMFYLLITNLLGLLPYTFTPTTQLSLNMALALPLWLATVFTGMRHQPTMAMAHLLPLGTPTPLIPILILIETASLLIRPLALGVRLTANLTAGHLLMTLISIASLALLPTSPTIALLTTILLILLSGLEIAVAMIQAYVFVLLLSLYLQENT
uniref:ATP synthase subunit a n=1 Tax=Pachydactylus punctatus TaxID=185352 RepID=A0A7R7J4S8_9SAUR|nr:ATPase subunit 6 [Pachydactylus punctatus]